MLVVRIAVVEANVTQRHKSPHVKLEMLVYKPNPKKLTIPSATTPIFAHTPKVISWHALPNILT